ncbi:hypothetical protein HDF26_003780 [Pedobacter cryoconitis]|uniref:hypothetical protein n=1 Tax=Pedobacter cryoconitis TaxID=188932 RepID=UPI0016097B37|nr:hypothetical protein [Pedobacter cryoconitis]MBB6273320.1 hypothetical protein [Pedobacter cryoconitis]
MKLQSTIKIFSSLLILSVIVLFTSCKKQYTDYSYSNLVSFSLKGNDGEILKGAITAKDITVYWPPFTQVPDSITPQITVAERASISPASGKKVAFKETTKYTVTAQDGSQTVYTLKPVINQPIPYISGFSPFYSHDNNGVRVFYPDTELDIQGDYFLTDSLATKVYLDIEGGNEIPMVITAIAKTRIISEVLSEKLKKGTYFKIKIISGSRTIYSGRCLMGEVLPLIPEADILYTKTFKAGDTFTLSGINIGTISTVSASASLTSTPQNLIIQSKTDQAVTIRIPDNIPAGTYGILNYAYTADMYHPAKTNILYTRLIIK